MPSRRQAGHEPVPGPGSEAGADVQAGGDPVEDDAPEHYHDLSRETVHGGHGGEHQVDHEADDDDVRESAEPGALTKRNPQQQDGDPDDDRPGTDPQAELARETLVEDVPRVEAEPGQQQHRAADAEQDEPDVELNQASYLWRLHARHRKESDSNGLCIGRPIC